ncbi:MAG: hypothetical protein P1V20_19175 [Verrucomicrobiales bacterium]|nr:hypothetical protein [Verrucomicrobiales bacterium]
MYQRIATFSTLMISISMLLAQGGQLNRMSGQEVMIQRFNNELLTQHVKDVPGLCKVVSQISFVPSDSSPSKSFIVAGKVVSDNTGAGLERVLVWIGKESSFPVVAAMTNVDGEFKFRLWIDDHDRRLQPAVKTSFEGYLYVGGHLAGINTKETQYVRRYALKELLAHSDGISE